MDKKYTIPTAKMSRILDGKAIGTTSAEKTQKLACEMCKVLLRKTLHESTHTNRGAVVIGLSGNLGGGKTTFLQGFAKGLGIKEKILSPTFVIMKRFELPQSSVVKTMLSRAFHYRNFYHVDCYRLKDEGDILELGWKEIISNPKNIVAVEWPEKIKKALPKNAILINFEFVDKNKRAIFALKE